MVLYNFGQVQRSSQVERKTKCSKKNNGWGYSRPLDCLVSLSVDADRIVRAGGVYLNKLRVTQPDQLLTLGQHILPNNITLLRTGKLFI